MGINCDPSTWSDTWPHRPGQYLHGPKPKEEVVIYRTGRMTGIDMDDRLKQDAGDHREQGGMR